METDKFLQAGFTPIDEGGYCKRIYTSPRGGERAITTAIEYILPSGGVSLLHCLDADEMWIHLGGGDLKLVWADTQGKVQSGCLKQGEHFIFPEGVVFGAREISGEDAHVICVVSPGYTDEGFRLVDRDEIARRWPQAAAQLEPYLK